LGERATSDVGLLGGRLEARTEHSRLPPIDSPFVLAPMKRPEDEARLRAFLEGRPVFCEIGFGRPHHLCDLAAARPELHVLGFEIRRRWCRAAAGRSEREGLDNVRVIHGDALSYIARYIPDASMDAYGVFFPDPWWKKRHHKRRVFRRVFMDELARTLAPGGALYVKTDVPAYADLIEDQLLAHPAFELAATRPDDPELAALPLSHREKKCAEHGIPVSMFRFTRKEQPR